LVLLEIKHAHDLWASIGARRPGAAQRAFELLEVFLVSVDELDLHLGECACGTLAVQDVDDVQRDVRDGARSVDDAYAVAPSTQCRHGFDVSLQKMSCQQLAERLGRSGRATKRLD